WHIMRQDFSQRGRALANIEHQIHHVAMDGPNQLAHVGIPLEVQAPDRAAARKALVGLDERGPLEKGELGLEIGLAEVLAEIAAMVREPAVADHLDVGNCQGLDSQDLHAGSPSPSEAVRKGVRPRKSGGLTPFRTASVALFADLRSGAI